MSMQYNEEVKFETYETHKHEERTGLYRVYKSGSPTGGTYVLQKFDGDEWNTLEDFDTSHSHAGRSVVESIAREKIEGYAQTNDIVTVHW